MLPHPAAATWDGSEYWVTDSMAEKIFEADAAGNLLGAADPPPMTDSQDLFAIAWIGDRLLAAVSEWGPGTTTVYELTPQ